MDFIPKSILNEVKKMKSTEKARALQVPTAPRSTTGSRLSPTKNKAIESQLSENMKMVLNTANRKNTDLENVVTPQAEERRSEIAKPTELQSVTNANATNMQASGFAGKLDHERQITPIENNIFKPQNEESKALTTRKEVAALRVTMNELIKSLGIDEKQKYPTEMELFVKVIQEENKIYNTVFKEIIRQVHVNMIERGEILAEIRDRYAKMFRRIPIQILELHTELVAHRKLNRRLSEELIRSKDNIAELLSQLDHVKEFDNELNSQAKEAQTKIITLLSTAQSAEESMEAFHKLYRMQRSRLENSLRLSEKEKRLWMDAATNLAIRIGHEYGIPDLLNLQKIEEARLRATNHMIVSIGDSDSNDLEKIEGHIDTWRNSLISLSNQIVSEDFQNIEVLCRIQKQMKAALRNLITNEPQNNIELGHSLLTEFHILDVQELMGHLHYWASEMMEVTGRFTSNRDVKVKEEATVARRLTFEWMEIALRLLRRKQESTNGEDYVPLMEILKSLRSQITDWTSNLQNRAAGEGGIVNTVAFIQSQLEDRLTLLGFKGANTPLAQEDRNSNIQLLNSLVEQINNLISTLSITSEKEQHKVPLLVENWITKVLDQINHDIDQKNEENISLHTMSVSWMVNLLLPQRNVNMEAPEQYLEIVEKLQKFNNGLIKDAADIIMLTDDRRDLRKMLIKISEDWIETAKKLLDSNLVKPLSAREVIPKELNTENAIRKQTGTTVNLAT